MFDPALLLPPGLSPEMALLLAGLSFVTSLITATFSLGGGMLMVAVLALVFPPAIVVPIHGSVQLGSNAGRALVQRPHIQWRLIVWITLGTLIGTILGGQFVNVVPAVALQVAIAVFIVAITWLPLPPISGRGRLFQVVGGTIISTLSMIVGATGPLTALFVKDLTDRRQLVATQAMLMTLQNILKIATFTLLGFGFASYFPLIGLMVVTGFAGTFAGSRLLVKVPESLFRWGFKLILTLVALDLLREAIF